MTFNEFNDRWLPEHASRFTGIREWLRKVTHGADAPSYEQILLSWFRVLEDVDLDEACRASQRMHAGELEEPKGFDRHPAAIRRACGRAMHSGARHRHYDADGNETFACPLCRDNGRVWCWSSDSVRYVMQHGFPKSWKIRPLYTTAVPCTCDAANGVSRGVTARYSPREFCVIEHSVSDERDHATLLKWLEERRPANYEPAFDA